ncbi:MAG: hypothetical protein RR847_01320 [Bacilli bacterium]
MKFKMDILSVIKVKKFKNTSAKRKYLRTKIRQIINTEVIMLSLVLLVTCFVLIFDLYYIAIALGSLAIIVYLAMILYTRQISSEIKNI